MLFWAQRRRFGPFNGNFVDTVALEELATRIHLSAGRILVSDDGLPALSRLCTRFYTVFYPRLLDLAV